MNTVTVGPAGFLWIAIAALIAGFFWALGAWILGRLTRRV